MPDRLLRPLLVIEFLVALQTAIAVWAELAGRYHMELIYWGWKAGLSVAAAGLIVAITANLVRKNGRLWLGLALCLLLLAVVAGAGMVTNYYHENEPGPRGEEDPGEDRISLTVWPDATRPGTLFRREPSAALPCS